jgi:hypothetical protein
MEERRRAGARTGEKRTRPPVPRDLLSRSTGRLSARPSSSAVRHSGTRPDPGGRPHPHGEASTYPPLCARIVRGRGKWRRHVSEAWAARQRTAMRARRLSSPDMLTGPSSGSSRRQTRRGIRRFPETIAFSDGCAKPFQIGAILHSMECVVTRGKFGGCEVHKGHIRRVTVTATWASHV